MKALIKTVFEGYVLDVYVQLEDKIIPLSYNGDKEWKSTDYTEVSDGYLDLIMICRGLNGTEWKISLAQDNEEEPFYERTGSIESKGYSKLVDQIKFPVEESNSSPIV